MGCIRPATPGFLLTALATALLAVVSFCVPYFKSIFFLQADISSNGVSGSITFGTLGYCVNLAGTTTCSKPAIGYELDINGLVGNRLPIQIPTVVVKWLTYALFLHVIALILAAGAAIFGLLAHVREMSMTYCSTLISGFAAVVALLAFIFDLVLFFIAKSRINAVGKATMGNAIWLTLAAWILLFFSGCFYTVGRCCISNRKRGDWDNRKTAPDPHAAYRAEEGLRLDAIKAEADRKARQKASEEGGLPAFHERQPLNTTAYDDGSNVYTDKPHTVGGYAPATPGTRTVDQYYENAYNSSAYPPPPQRNNNNYAPSTYSNNAPPQRQNTYPTQQYQSTPPAQPTYQATPPAQQPYQSTPPVPLPYQSTTPQQSYPPQQSLSPPPGGFAALGAIRTASPQQQQPNPYLDPNPNPNPYLGHAPRGTSYHSAASHGGDYSQYDPYDAGVNAQAQGAEYFNQSPYTTQYNTPQGQSQYSNSPAHDDPYGGYSGGGDGYGQNTVPPLATSGYFPAAGPSADMPPKSPSSPKGPRSHRHSLRAMNIAEEEPPRYEQGSEHVPGAWGKS
ncbi:hypothetical protein MIND_00548900 [Mycena indigotica]|uniref:Pali-domain-containing protein n=1 Tax=Mycena indigotica TaxID=2126181 RepID=A0A8H6SZJ7_9AGAR|nr:uncharacterized protein MIND_00548900 [Mycena indigotica]KAF7307541.1 hypothetical protein MIND_00548900 [Mycena indigotica]